MRRALTFAAVVALSLGALASGIVRNRIAAAGLGAGWRLQNGDRPDISDADGGAVRFAFRPGGHNWGNMSVGIEIPPDAIGFSWKEMTVSAEPAAQRFLWLHERDGDLWCYALPKRAVASNVWHDVVVTFDMLSYQPRGDRKRALHTVSRLAMGFNFARQTVLVKDLEVLARPAGERRAERRAAGGPDSAARIVVLDCMPEKPHAYELLAKAGLGARLASSADFADPRHLSRANADLAIIPCSPFFPAAAVDNFKSFLKAGGAFFAFGGYAFDHVGNAPDEAAENALMMAPSVADANAGLLGRTRINSRHGRSGDTVTFSKDVIAIFDPSFLVRHAARTVASRGQTLLEPQSPFPLPPTGKPYFAAVAMTGSNSPVFPDVQARWIPVLEAQDRFGRSRGPVLSLVIPYAGPYASSAWAFSGHPELFRRAEPAADRLFVDVCRRLLAPAAITTFKAYPPSVEPNETVSLEVAAARLPPDARCRFLCGGRVIGEHPFAEGRLAGMRLSPGNGDADGRGLVKLAAQIVSGGRTIDVKETAVVIRKDVAGPSFEFRDNMFAIDGRRRFFGGMNTTGMMWYSDNENPLVWGRDFADMADYGMKFLRILHFSPFSTTNHPERITHDPKSLAVTPPEKTCRQTDAIMQLSAASGVGVMLALHDWLPWELEEDELEAEAGWNRFWAGRYRNLRSVFYDIQNEPGPHRMKKFSGGRRWTDLAARDGERRRAAYFDRWQRRNADAVHAVNPRAAVTTGHLQNLDAVEKQLSTAGIDFSNVHHYGAVADLRCVVKLVDRRFEGKGLSLGEFGARVSHDARARGDTDDPSELAIRHFLQVNHYLYGMGGAFSGVWDWKEFQDCTFPWGVTWQDGTPKPVLKAYRNMCLVLGEAGAMKESPALWLVLPDSFRLGGDSGRIHAAVRNAADALLTLNVPFGVINEEGLARLPSSAAALVWPMAVCPSDSAFAAVAGFVKRGGSLLVTGDFRYDADRRPTRLARPADLGLAADFPPLDPYAGELPASACARSAGKVTWSPRAVELVGEGQDEIRALYREFLDVSAKIPRLAVPNARDGDVIRFASSLEDGGRCETAVNATGAGAAFGQVRLAPHSVFWRRFSPDGGMRALTMSGEASGFKVVGAPCAMLSLDANPLSASRAVALLPFGPCEVTAPDGGVLRRRRGEIGEFRGRRWRPLEQGGPASGVGKIVVPDDETAYDIRLFADDEARDAAVKALERLL